MFALCQWILSATWLRASDICLDSQGDSAEESGRPWAPLALPPFPLKGAGPFPRVCGGHHTCRTHCCCAHPESPWALSFSLERLLKTPCCPGKSCLCLGPGPGPAAGSLQAPVPLCSTWSLSEGEGSSSPAWPPCSGFPDAQGREDCPIGQHLQASKFLKQMFPAEHRIP